ncbi:unnamed protein product [Ectocarpus sp. 12 AP-2014]
MSLRLLYWQRQHHRPMPPLHPYPLPPPFPFLPALPPLPHPKSQTPDHRSPKPRRLVAMRSSPCSCPLPPPPPPQPPRCRYSRPDHSLRNWKPQRPLRGAPGASRQRRSTLTRGCRRHHPRPQGRPPETRPAPSRPRPIVPGGRRR